MYLGEGGRGGPGGGWEKGGWEKGRWKRDGKRERGGRREDKEERREQEIQAIQLYLPLVCLDKQTPLQWYCCTVSMATGHVIPSLWGTPLG